MSGAVSYPDGHKPTILLHCLGVKGKRVYCALPDVLSPVGTLASTTTEQAESATATSTSSTTFPAVVSKLDKFFMPTLNRTLELYKFRFCAQLHKERVEEYANAQRRLASTCHFRDFQDEIICDQLVEKVRSKKYEIVFSCNRSCSFLLLCALTIASRVEHAM